MKCWTVSAALCSGTYLLLTLWSVPVAAQTRDDYCGRTPHSGFQSAPDLARTGRYLNDTYGYALTVPAGLTAYADGRTPERGIVVELANQPRTTLSVDAAYDIFYDITAEGVHRRDINTIRLHDSLVSDEAGISALAHVAGGRYVLRLQCQGAAASVVHEEVIVVRNREIYRVDLQTTPERYAADRRQLDALIRSWRWVRPRPP